MTPFLVGVVSGMEKTAGAERGLTHAGNFLVEKADVPYFSKNDLGSSAEVALSNPRKAMRELKASEKGVRSGSGKMGVGSGLKMWFTPEGKKRFLRNIESGKRTLKKVM
jgi:hypothetical protein